jgi:2-hydroxychromene-2-carboxylate isomerase
MKRSAAPLTTIRFYFDYKSPFSFLAKASPPIDSKYDDVRTACCPSGSCQVAGEGLPRSARMASFSLSHG